MRFPKGSLKKFRQNRRIRQCELAQASGLSASVISLIENNWVCPNSDDIEKLVLGYRRLGVHAGPFFQRYGA